MWLKDDVRFLSKSSRCPAMIQKYPNPNKQNLFKSYQPATQLNWITDFHFWTQGLGSCRLDLCRIEDDLLIAFAKTIGRGSRVSNYSVWEFLFS